MRKDRVMTSEEFESFKLVAEAVGNFTRENPDATAAEIEEAQQKLMAIDAAMKARDEEIRRLLAVGSVEALEEAFAHVFLWMGENNKKVNECLGHLGKRLVVLDEFCSRVVKNFKLVDENFQNMGARLRSLERAKKSVARHSFPSAKPRKQKRVR